MRVNKGVLYLRDTIDFPPVEESLDDGLLAAGGDLSEKRLLNAYRSGIFPWYSEYSPILWYSPPVRCIIKPDGFNLSHSLKLKLKNNDFTISLDKNFEDVINACASIKRKGESGTWILPEMIEAYTELHKSGYAHSVEVWHKGKLAGGLYGVSLGRAFFGESMFHKVTDASKAALHYLCTWLQKQNFNFIDAQNETRHLLSLGAITINRSDYLIILKEALNYPTIRGNWNKIQNL
jgi:leucyl/phenylalanyl-tRNA--protein transferase